jgi:hypothetical protein
MGDGRRRGGERVELEVRWGDALLAAGELAPGAVLVLPGGERVSAVGTAAGLALRTPDGSEVVVGSPRGGSSRRP